MASTAQPQSAPAPPEVPTAGQQNPASSHNLLTILAAGSALVLLLSYLAIALAHARDSYQVHIVAGIWMSLAEYLNLGKFYPPLSDGEHLFSTRYMPVYFSLHAGLAHLTGDYLLSGKILSLCAMLAAVLLLYRAARQAGAPWAVSLLLASLLPASRSGYLAGTTIRGDLLPVVWQLAALALVAQRFSPARLAGAGLLCTLAFLTKLSAIWAPLGIFSYLLWRDRRSCLVFLLTYLGSLGLSLGALHWATEGRMLASFGVISETRETSLRLALKAPFRLLYYLNFSGHVPLLLLPLLFAEWARVVHRGAWSVYHHAALFCLLSLVPIYMDRGTDINHMVDLVAVSAVLLAYLWCSLGDWSKNVPNLHTVAAATLLLAAWMSWAGDLAHEARDVAGAVLGGTPLSHPPARPLAGFLPDNAHILTEAPLVSVSRGQLPVVMDAYAVPYLERKHPELVSDLVRRIEAREFDAIVLLHRLDQGLDVNGDWYKVQFGLTVARAIRANYRFQTSDAGYCLFVPDRPN